MLFSIYRKLLQNINIHVGGIEFLSSYGIFADVYADDADDVWLEVLHGRHNGATKYDRFRRTTIGMELGFIECLNAKMEVRDEP